MNFTKGKECISVAGFHGNSLLQAAGKEVMRGSFTHCRTVAISTVGLT